MADTPRAPVASRPHRRKAIGAATQQQYPLTLRFSLQRPRGTQWCASAPTRKKFEDCAPVVPRPKTLQWVQPVAFKPGGGSAPTRREWTGDTHYNPFSYRTSAATITGSGAILLEELLVDGEGTRTSNGIGAISLEAFTVEGAGFRTVNGTGAIGLDALQVAGTGQRTANGVGAILLSEAQVDGVGTVSSGQIGSGALSLESITVDGAGVRTSNGTGAILLAALTVDGTGTVTQNAEGSGSLVLEQLQVSGIGKRALSGSGAILLGEFQVSGYDVPPTPTSPYKYIDGTAFDEFGRMMTVPVASGDPLPAGSKRIMGIAHTANGRRYVTSWPGSAQVKRIDGFALRVDGVQIVAPDAGIDSALAGIPVTYRRETVVSDENPVKAVSGWGLDSAGRLTVTNHG